MVSGVDEIAKIYGEAIERRRNDPNTPKCASWYCQKPSMMMRNFEVDGKETWIMLCDDCDMGLLWSNNNYIQNIQKICAGYDLRTGELRST